MGWTGELSQGRVYADDGYIKGNLTEVLPVLDEIKSVLKEDEGLDLNISKTDILPKDITGTGRPKDRDEVNRRDVSECDG